VHLSDWPAPAELRPDGELVLAMDLVRDVCSAAHAVREANGRRVRLPLRSLVVATEHTDRLAPYAAIIEDEVNVRQVVFTRDVGDLADRVLTVVPAALGPRLGPDTQRVIKAVKDGRWRHVDGGVDVDGIVLEEGEYALTLRPRDPDRGRTLPGDAGVVVLDTDVDDELEAEGLARDVVRLVQMARRDAGLHVADHIVLELAAPAPTNDAVERHRAYVAEQTLADDVRLTVADEVVVTVTKASGPANR